MIERPGSAMPNLSRAPFTERGALRLLVQSESFLSNWRDSLVALTSRAAPRSSIAGSRFLRGSRLPRGRLPGRSIGASFLLHCLVVVLVVYLPMVLPVENASVLSAAPYEERIYYRLPLLDPEKMPHLAPAGPGGRPGSGFRPTRAPLLGGTAPQPRVTIVSNPVHPDNRRQTIYQPVSPPELKITAELKLPNIIALRPLERPQAPIVPTDVKPTFAKRQIADVAAPAVDASLAPPQTLLLKPSDTQPRLTIPLSGGGGAPVVRSRDGSASAAEAPSVDAADLMVLGVDPANSTSQLSLPGGNRWGEFSIAPPGKDSGSAGGTANGAFGGGTSGALTGDASSGVGAGESGGGGGNRGTAGFVSIAGPGAGEAPAGSLDPTLPMNMVYPVAASAIRIRKNALVISAGPIGGGSLNVYGALKCGKIYSIFLPMPEGNWSMQYCDPSARNQKPASGGVVHLDKPLIPPDFDPSRLFDFRRTPVPVEKAYRSVILKGVIAVDGSVQHLVVYQGVTPVMDEAARIAFGRWHFQPAMRDGKAVEVEILVGIPALAGEDRMNR